MRALRLVLAVSVAVIGLSDLASADLLFDGSEFQVNTYTTNNQTGLPAKSVARAPDGSFVVVWTSFGQDGSSYSVHGQRYDSTGAAAGSEFQVNTYTTGYQFRPAVSAANGGFVVVWTSPDGSAFGVHGQRYNSAGAAAGTEFQVNTYTTSHQRGPAVSAAGDGSFVVVWNSSGQDGSSYSVHGQRYDSTGAAAGTEFRVNTYTTGSQYNLSVSAAAGGSFVVVWNSSGQDGSNSGVHGQRYDSTGAAAGTEFQVNTYTTGFQYNLSVSAAAGGSFVVVWHSDGQDGSGRSVQGQRYNDAGAATGTEFQVNTYTTDDQEFPAVSAAAGGSFVVVWNSSGQDGDYSSVHGQRYDSTGAAAGTEFQINTYTTNDQGYANSIAVDAAGDFVVVWQSSLQDGAYIGMFGQRLCEDSNSNSVCDSTETPTSGCGASPAAGCITGAKASFQLKDSTDASKDQIKWKLSKGGAFDQAALGDPVISRTYSLCIYDSTGNTDSLVATLEIDPNVNWTSKAPKGFQYKDKIGTEDGVTKAKLKTGDAGKTSASIGAKGANIPMPAAVSEAMFFNQDSTVTVQLVNNQTTTCWTSAFTTAKKNDGVQFKATAP